MVKIYFHHDNCLENGFSCEEKRFIPLVPIRTRWVKQAGAEVEEEEILQSRRRFSEIIKRDEIIAYKWDFFFAFFEAEKHVEKEENSFRFPSLMLTTPCRRQQSLIDFLCFKELRLVISIIFVAWMTGERNWKTDKLFNEKKLRLKPEKSVNVTIDELALAL